MKQPSLSRSQMPFDRTQDMLRFARNDRAAIAAAADA
jgi:hypothetical protein